MYMLDHHSLSICCFITYNLEFLTCGVSFTSDLRSSNWKGQVLWRSKVYENEKMAQYVLKSYLTIHTQFSFGAPFLSADERPLTHLKRKLAFYIPFTMIEYAVGIRLRYFFVFKSRFIACFFRDNFLRINIYFEELNMEKITYSEYYLVSLAESIK